MRYLIDRDELRNAMYHEAMEKDSDEQQWNGGCWIRYKMFERVVGSIPIMQPSELLWIPCSERLPIRPSSYIVTGKMKYSFEKEWQYFTDVAYNYGKEIDNFWETCNDWDEGQEIHIIAWMPIPDPWKGDKK